MLSYYIEVETTIYLYILVGATWIDHVMSGLIVLDQVVSTLD